MPAKKTKGKPSKSSSASINALRNEYVSSPYRSATMYGRVVGVADRGTSRANTMYSVSQMNHYQGEKSIIHRLGKNLTVVSKETALNAIKKLRERQKKSK